MLKNNITKIISFCLVVLFLASTKSVYAYVVVAETKKATAYEEGEIKHQDTKDKIRYEVDEKNKTITQTEVWIETLPEKVNKIKKTYQIIAVDDAIPSSISNEKKLQQKVIYAISKNTLTADQYKRTTPSLLILGQDFFCRYTYDMGEIEISEGIALKVE